MAQESQPFGPSKDPLGAALAGASAVAKTLVPPHGRLDLRSLLETLRLSVNAEAASVFLVKEDDPNQLCFEEGLGYKEEYRKKRYYVGVPTLTNWVYKTRTPINECVQSLRSRREKGELDFSDSCRFYLTSEHFRNIISVPVLVGESCIGVLKIENMRGEGRKFSTLGAVAFPDDALNAARVLSSFIALAVQQRKFRRMYDEFRQVGSRFRTVKTYLQEVTSLMAGFINAECCAVFLVSAGPNRTSVLRYEAGIGYVPAYASSEYAFGDDSLTGYVAAHGAALCRTESELFQLKSPAGVSYYRGACRSFISSGTFRGVLLVPLETEGGHRIGVLKLENKKPDTPGVQFDRILDLGICQALVRDEIVPTIQNLDSRFRRPRPLTPGMSDLRRAFGEPEQLRGRELATRAREMAKIVRVDGSRVTASDCIAHLKISRSHFYRLTSADRRT